MCNNKKNCSCSCKKSSIKETKLLSEAIDLNISTNRKREAVKQAKNANDAILSLYDLCQKSEISNEKFLNILDKCYKTTNALLTILLVQTEHEEETNQEQVDNS